MKSTYLLLFAVSIPAVLTPFLLRCYLLLAEQFLVHLLICDKLEFNNKVKCVVLQQEQFVTQTERCVTLSDAQT